MGWAYGIIPRRRTHTNLTRKWQQNHPPPLKYSIAQPGLPVYVAAGIVLVPSASRSLGLFFATAYTCVVCLIMKLTACALQQKVIGESMSHWVSVRQAVNINSDFMRTFKLVLSDEGVSAEKVALLIGGPDWPTSVNC